MINPLTELKKKLAPRSRWGAIHIAPPREGLRLHSLDAEQRRQPQDGALSNADYMLDEPEVSPIVQLSSPKLARSVEPQLHKPAIAS